MATVSTGSIIGDTPSSVTLLTLLRNDTGLPPMGVPLPASMTLSGSPGVWTYTFTDPAGDSQYNGTYQLNWSDGSSSNPIGFPISNTPPSAAQMVNTLKTALLSNPAATITVVVDGQTVTYSRAQAIDELKFWQREAAKEAGARPRSMRIRLDRAF